MLHMYKQTLITFSTLLIASCTSGPSSEVTEVMWHGASPNRTYVFTFVDMTDTPVPGVTFHCSGAENSIAMYVASDLNQSASLSDESGILKISHNGFQTHGTYKQKGSKTWDHQMPDSPYCEFYYRNHIVLSGSIRSFNSNQTVVVSQPAT